MSFENVKIIKTEPLPASEAVWTRLVKTTYLDPKGIQRTWEYGERPTRPANSDIDGVGIIAILKKPSGPEIVLQKQYRPPLDKTASEAAVREMKEETGYVGVVEESETSTIMFNDPGFCNTNLRLVHLSIDLSNSANQDLKPELEENEFIEVFSVRLSKLWDECRRLEKEGIESRVGKKRKRTKDTNKRWKIYTEGRMERGAKPQKENPTENRNARGKPRKQNTSAVAIYAALVGNPFQSQAFPSPIGLLETHMSIPTHRSQSSSKRNGTEA
ncbi:hypothetical protein B7463_g9939, partial [Scytalidium lignicola]